MAGNLELHKVTAIPALIIGSAWISIHQGIANGLFFFGIAALIYFSLATCLKLLYYERER